MWLAVGSTAVMTVVLAVWMIPWVPVGMTPEDYNPAVRVALALAIGSTVLSLLALFARQPIDGEGEIAQVWHSLLGSRTTLRNRTQFHKRLARECERAQRDQRRRLSLLLVRVQENGDRGTRGRADAFEHVAGSMVPVVRSSDIIGMAGDSELGVLAIGADAKAREIISLRFEPALASALRGWWVEAGVSGREALVSLGASTFGADGIEPGRLLAAARDSLTPVIPGSRRAA